MREFACLVDLRSEPNKRFGKTLLKIRQKNKTLIGCRMKFLFWLMNFKILSGEISEANFYETAEKMPGKSMHRGNGENRNRERSVTHVGHGHPAILLNKKNSLDKNFNRIYIFGSKINLLPET